MEITSEQCRVQEAIQQERARSEPLENVRIVANRAAIAWGHEAKAAQLREARRIRRREITEVEKVQEQPSGNSNLTCASENPDRGFADA